MSNDVTVTDDPQASRYVATVDGDVAGYVEYRLDDDRIVFTTTQVDDDQEGQGVGSALAEGALAGARERGLAVVPECNFIAAHIGRNPQHAELVAT